MKKKRMIYIGEDVNALLANVNASRLIEDLLRKHFGIQVEEKQICATCKWLQNIAGQNACLSFGKRRMWVPDTSVRAGEGKPWCVWAPKFIERKIKLEVVEPWRN